jgi:hypothetical protein
MGDAEKVSGTFSRTPYRDVRPALPEPKDAKDGKWTDEDGNGYLDRGDYTRAIPPWSKSKRSPLR